MNIKIEVGISYDSDLENVENISINTAKKVVNELGGVLNFEPIVRFHSFSDFSIMFNLIIRIQKFDQQFYFKHTLIKALYKKFKEENVEIPFPVRTIINKNN